MNWKIPSLTVLFLATNIIAEEAASPEGIEFFEKKIRPVLVDRCYSCHSSEAKKLKAGLRLDTREDLRKGGESGSAIIPGEPDKSLLIRAIRYADKEFQMPPKDKLPAEVIADFVQWVRMGAPDPRIATASPLSKAAPQIDFAEARKFWAFQPMSETEPPEVRNRGWVKTPVDQFILSALEARKLKPAPALEKRKLIRRATFDLTGLPPSPEEIKAFLEDQRPQAYPALVERLLASPRYGERWGRHWLDVARYTDSNGLDENLAYASAFRYRDYVVSAFNADKPYDRFVQEQIAGDLLTHLGESEEQRRERLTATGFLSLGPKMLAEDDPMKMEMDIIDEQVDTVGKAFLGLTLGCARCHDHKFDPIPTADYYSMAGIFKSTKTMENFKVVAVWHEYPMASKEQTARKEEHEKKVRDNETAVKERTRAAQKEFLDAQRKLASKYLRQAFLISNTQAKTTNLVADVAKTEALNEDILSQWVAFLEKAFADDTKLWTEWKALKAHGKPEESAKLAERYHERFLEAEEKWKLLQETPGKDKPARLADEGLEAFRFVLRDAKGPFQLPKNPERFYSTNAKTGLKELEDQRKKLDKSRPDFPTAMGVREGTASNLKVHLRGNYLTQGAEVPRRFPRVLGGDLLPPIANSESGRLQLATWMTTPEHPLTARVMVNRIWKHHFGNGLVRSVDNFGSLGERPTNPQLLDWLSREFVQRKWSVKEMHRLIMLSATYQAGSDVSGHLALVDPENRLHGRMDRRRLEAEEVRDAILTLGGKLDYTMGGQKMTYKNRDYVTGTGARVTNFESNRRSIYLPVLRSAVYEVLQSFDFPDPSVLNGERAATTVTPQALFMMNGELVATNSLLLADQLISRSEWTDSQRIVEAWTRALGRAPTRQEAKRILVALKQLESELKKEKCDDAELRRRSWRSLARVLIAGNEFMYIE